MASPLPEHSLSHSVLTDFIGENPEYDSTHPE